MYSTQRFGGLGSKSLSLGRIMLMAICPYYVPHLCVVVATSKVVTQKTSLVLLLLLLLPIPPLPLVLYHFPLFYLLTYFCSLLSPISHHACLYMASLILSSKEEGQLPFHSKPAHLPVNTHASQKNKSYLFYVNVAY